MVAWLLGNLQPKEAIMNNALASLLFTLMLSPGTALAQEGMVTIMSPANGAMVSANDKIMLKYQADPGPEGDHLHLNVDGKRQDVIHRLQGTTEVDPLPPGKHHICLAVNTRGHVPTGVEGCIDVTAK